MKLARLFWKLLRYRVAVMLILFMLLASSIHQSLTVHPWLLIIAGIALAFSYISATSSNDLADRKIDAINHPSSPGRPLITGSAQAKDMWIVFGLASTAAVLLCSFINWRAVIIIFVSILINVLYSLPPVRLSYRTFLAPLALGLAYVVIPYSLALVATNSHFIDNDFIWLLGLYIMFVGRIILKDFRDRKGDAKYDKPTFLLRFGKKATCITSAVWLTAGGLLFILQVRHFPWLAVLVAIYLVAILFMLVRLLSSAIGRDEQISIGVGAKMGNGLLITLLSTFTLQETGASTATQITIAMVLAALFFSNYFSFLLNPQKAIIGYKG